MDEADALDEVVSLLEYKYGPERVVLEPSLDADQGVYPDAAVFEDEELTVPFLLVEWSSLRTGHRTEKDLREVSEAVSSTDAEYGALLGPNVRFIFSGSSPAFRSYADLPPLEGEVTTQRRPVESEAELDFLISRCMNAHDEIRRKHSSYEHDQEVADEFLESLHLLIELRRQDLPAGGEVDPSVIDDVYVEIEQRHEWYESGEALDSRLVSSTAAVFNGFDLGRTEDSVLESLFEVTHNEKRGGAYSTPLEVARQMVRLAGTQPGDLVLDPAAGRGTVLSLAAGRGAHGEGVEINPAVLRIATFYVDLFDRDVHFTVGNFFEKDRVQDPFDRVIVDPPFNMRLEDVEIPYTEGRDTLMSEEAFIAKGLSLLEDGGTVTISVPSGFLDNQRRNWFRELVLDTFELRSIVQFVDGPLYRHTSIDTAIVTLSNQSAAPDHEVQYAIIDSPEDPEMALRHAASNIDEGTAKSIPQNQLESSWDIRKVVAQRSVRADLEAEYANLTHLEDIADVSMGNRPENLLEKEHEDTLRYLSISNIGKGRDRHGDRYIPRENTKTIADETCVLIATIGDYTYTHIPSDPVAPAQDLAVVQFGTSEEALVYEAFFESELGQRQIDSYKSGSRISRVNISDLREMLVPNFSSENIQSTADDIRSHRQQTKELERRQKELEQEKESLDREVSDFLSGGDDDE